MYETVCDLRGKKAEFYFGFTTCGYLNAEMVKDKDKICSCGKTYGEHEKEKWLAFGKEIDNDNKRTY